MNGYFWQPFSLSNITQNDKRDKIIELTHGSKTNNELETSRPHILNSRMASNPAAKRALTTLENEQNYRLPFFLCHKKRVSNRLLIKSNNLLGLRFSRNEKNLFGAGSFSH